MQVGAPRELYDRPGNAHVARFFGDNNLIEGRVLGVSARHARVETPLGVLGARCGPGITPGDTVLLAIRPEKICLLAPGQTPGAEDLLVSGSIGHSGFAGPLTQLLVTPDAAPSLTLSVKRLSDFAPGVQGPVRLCWPVADAWVVPA